MTGPGRSWRQRLAILGLAAMSFVLLASAGVLGYVASVLSRIDRVEVGSLRPTEVAAMASEPSADDLLRCRLEGISIKEQEELYERITGKIAVGALRPSYLILNDGFGRTPQGEIVKRVTDIVSRSIVSPCRSHSTAIASARAARGTTSSRFPGVRTRTR